jgi:diguanylate cyclase (GGDEF)-like protein/PAS domain S-box-containing protein
MNPPSTDGSLAHGGPTPDEPACGPAGAPDAVPPGSGPLDDRTRHRVTLARKWAYLLAQTSYLPWSHQELEQRLLGLVDELVDVTTAQPFDARRAEEVGARLVEWRCTDPASLRRTLDVLGPGLLALPELARLEGIARRVVAVAGAFAAGYADAVRLFTIEQQENLNLALLNAKQNLLTSEARFDHVAAISASGIAITDLDGRFVRTNTALGRILGCSPAELAGLSLFDVVRLDREDLLRELYRDLRDGPADRLRQVGRLQRKDDGSARVSLTASLLRSEDGVPNQFVTVVEDATELSLLQDELLRQSLHDMLTGLPNRQFFTTRLESLLHRADRAAGITLYHLDLDAFSVLVAGLGLRAGERLLVAVAERLRTVVDTDRSMVARFEGDEFGILVENLPGTMDVVRTVDRINDVLSDPIDVDGFGVLVSASIGVVHRPPGDLSPIELLGAAETTLRRAQRNGRRQWELFDQEKDTRDRERARLAVTMPSAWEAGELRAGYRTLVRLEDEEIVGVAPVLSWHHPGLGVLDHARCLALADQAGLGLPLGWWLLRSACTQVAQWRWRGRDVALHVDLTAQQANDPDLVGALLRVLHETGYATDRLLVSMPVAELAADGAATANLTLLSDVGVATVLRDVGTGQRDLALLAELPVRAVRLSPWQVPPDHGGASVLAALVVAVREAGVDVIVDDVRTGRQALWWREIGATTASGDFFAPVGSSDDTVARLFGR